MTHSFSIGDAVKFGWDKLKSHSALVFGVVLTMFALQVASSVVQRTLADTGLGAAASIVLAILGVILGAGATVIALKLSRGGHAHYRDIVPKLSLVWRYFAASLVAGVITFLPIAAGGLVALGIMSSTGSVDFSTGAVEGGYAFFALIAVIALAALCGTVYLALRYSFVKFAVLDGAGIIESLGQSTKLTHGVKWHLFLMVLVLIALNIAGAVALLVGLLVSVPVSLLAYTHVYLKLKEHRHH